MMDVREDDLVAIAPVMRHTFRGDPTPVKTVVVARIIRSDGSYIEPETDKPVENVIINFIGVDLNGLPGHYMYGHLYPCYIKRNTAK